MSAGTNERVSKEQLHQALISLRHSVGKIHNLLKLDTGLDLEAFFKVLDSKLLTQLNPDYPLMVAITGGGSTGKSSLFNALVGKKISTVQSKAGLSRRVLAAIHPDVLACPGFLASLFEAFEADPEPLGAIEELTVPGVPKYVSCPEVPSNLVLLDTPDFDTGDQNDYSNRGIAKPVLEACDVLIYIFVNQTYNSLANKQFIRHVITDVGNRKVLLVYRCSAEYTEDEVREHSDAVVRNIYGDDYQQWCLGIYRSDEDNKVVKGDAFMSIRPLDDGRGIKEVLGSLDRAQTRADFIQLALREVQRDANKTLKFAKAECLKIELYRDAVRIATSWAVTKALRSYPQCDLLQKFAEIWERGQPRTLKILKGVGKAPVLLAKPFLWVAGKVRNRFWQDESPPPKGPDAELVLEKNLREAANELRTAILGPELTVKTTTKDINGHAMIGKVDKYKVLQNGPCGDTPRYESLGSEEFNIFVDRPAVLALSASGLKAPNWKAGLDCIAEEAKGSVKISDPIVNDLRLLAAKFRTDMTWRQKIREIGTASLEVLPALGAVTYVFLTGDALAGAPTIYAKLTALFGLNDLWALTAIPASIGLKAADRHNLQKLLEPIFATWFNEKAKKVYTILEKHVTGMVLHAAEETLQHASKPVEELNSALENLRMEEKS